MFLSLPAQIIVSEYIAPLYDSGPLQTASETGGILTYCNVLEIALPNDVTPQPDAMVSVQPSYVYLLKNPLDFFVFI